MWGQPPSAVQAEHRSAAKFVGRFFGTTEVVPFPRGGQKQKPRYQERGFRKQLLVDAVRQHKDSVMKSEVKNK